MRTREEILDYWRSPNDGKNDPERFLGPVHRSQWLAERLEGLVDKADSVLEVGCNSGRNLAYLHRKGWRDIHGIEISERAVEVLKREMPWMEREGRIWTGPAEDELFGFAPEVFDCVLTMACLMHLHPETAGDVFLGMRTVARKRIVIVERFKAAKSWREFSRDYDQDFAGMEIERAEPVEGIEDLEGFEFRSYRKREETK